MLPESLTSSYKQYKVDTDVFVSWLLTIAKAHAFTNPYLVEEKARAGTDAEALIAAVTKPTYKVSLDEITRLASFLAGQVPPVRVPRSIIHKIQRTIAARRELASWYAKQPASSSTTNEGHIHFANILKSVLVVLEPLAPVSHPERQATFHRPNHFSKNMSPSNNRFETLDVESIESEDDANLNQQGSSSADAQPKDEFTLVVEELFKDEELAQQVFFFFQDLHKIEQFILDTWAEVVSKNTSVEIAAIVTNAALVMVKQMETALEEAMIEADPAGDLNPSSWLSFNKILLNGNVQFNVENITPTMSLIYFPTYRILQKPGIIQTDNKGYPFHIPSLAHELPIDPENIYIKKWQDEDRYLTSLLNELGFYAALRRDASQEVHKNVLPLDEASRLLYCLQDCPDG
ncbi:hypothetical protein MMC25_003544 [Agyrium rufum]|nr:hypothetical protein [Agyrium rufum]